MRKIRRKWSRPKRPWSPDVLEGEKKILKEFGLRRKREIRVAEEVLRGFRGRARSLIALKDEKEEATLLNKVSRLGLLGNGGDEVSLDNILALSINDILERRLQTLVFKRGMAKSVKHARQLIVHGFISIDGRRMPFPSFIVPNELEPKIDWFKSPPKDSEPAKPVQAPSKDAVEGEAAEETKEVEETAEQAEEAGEEKAEEPKEETKETPEEETKTEEPVVEEKKEGDE